MFKQSSQIRVTFKEIRLVFNLLEKTHQLTMLEELKDYTPFQLLVATLLSSRTKDKTTIPIVKRLFAEYPGPKEMVDVPIKKLEKMLYSIGFYRVKAKVLKKLCRQLLDLYDGKVPDTFDSLVSLPGVGRKTANCILSYVFGKPAIAVDTHVHRISNRLGWIDTNSPKKSESALQKIVSKKSWNDINRLFVSHGQRTCFPRKPNCGTCLITDYCKYYQNKYLEKKED